MFNSLDLHLCDKQGCKRVKVRWPWLFCRFTEWWDRSTSTSFVISRFRPYLACSCLRALPTSTSDPHNWSLNRDRWETTARSWLRSFLMCVAKAIWVRTKSSWVRKLTIAEIKINFERRRVKRRWYAILAIARQTPRQRSFWGLEFVVCTPCEERQPKSDSNQAITRNLKAISTVYFRRGNKTGPYNFYCLHHSRFPLAQRVRKVRGRYQYWYVWSNRRQY